MPEIDGIGGGYDVHWLSVVQNQILQHGARYRLGVWAGVELYGGKRHIGFHGGKLVERPGNNGLTFHKTTKRKILAKVLAWHQVVQRGEREAWDGNNRFAAIIAFHAPLAASVDLNVIQRGGGGQREQGQLGGGGNRKAAVGATDERGVWH